MSLNRATVLCLIILLILISCNGDSEKSKAREQNADRFSNREKKDAHFVVDVIDTSYGLINVAQLGEEKLTDQETKIKLNQFIQTQTSAMVRLKAFAEGRGIVVPFSGPEKTKGNVTDLMTKNERQFGKAWFDEMKKLQHKLKTDIEGYRKETNDTMLVNVLDSTLMMVRTNNRIISDLELDKESI
jgi:hypothetical protein